MNYRHAYHAGNFADVHKHIVLLALLQRLKRKPTPIFYLDTHAGRGWYDLRSEEASRAAEWRTGIARLAAPAAPSAHDIRYYLQTIGSLAEGQSRRYPGSPLLAAYELRKGDRAVFVEVQPEEARALERAVEHQRGISVHTGDGYAALKAHLPPRENRGLVLIDPPFESAEEFSALKNALQSAMTRWPNGMLALWYPIKTQPELQRWHATVRACGVRKLLALELCIRPLDSPAGLNGSGMLIANPPWKLDEEMQQVQRELLGLLEQQPGGDSNVEWLVGE